MPRPASLSALRRGLLCCGSLRVRPASLTPPCRGAIAAAKASTPEFFKQPLVFFARVPHSVPALAQVPRLAGWLALLSPTSAGRWRHTVATREFCRAGFVGSATPAPGAAKAAN